MEFMAIHFRIIVAKNELPYLGLISVELDDIE